MKVPLVIRMVLRVYPLEFRARFADEIGEYLAIRCDELARSGRLHCAWFMAPALDIVRTGLIERHRALRSSAGSMCLLLFVGAGFIPAAVLLTLALLIFEQLVREPLNAMHHAGRNSMQTLLLPAAMAVVVAGLAGLLRELRKAPSTRQRP